MRKVVHTILSFSALAALNISCVGAYAENPITLAMPSFDTPAAESFQVNGDATVSGADLRLTKDAPFLWGTAVNSNFTTLGPDSSFSAYFTFSMYTAAGGKGMGADGLAFLLQNNITTQGGIGGSIGYSKAGTSVAVEFDTYMNGDVGDPDSNHIGINLNGSPKSVALVPSPYQLNNGAIYHAWVDYDGTKGVLEVRLSDSEKRPAEPTLAHAIQIADIFPGSVFIGFTAATGAGHEEHAIKSLYFHREFVEGGLDPAKNEYVTATEN